MIVVDDAVSELIRGWRDAGARVSDADVALIVAARARLSNAGANAEQRGLEMAAALASLHLDAETLAAAMLCAVPDLEIESDTAKAKWEAAFGAQVVALIEGARRMDEIRAMRAEFAESRRSSDRGAQLEALRKMLLAMVQDVRVVLIKLADQLSRLRQLVYSGTDEARHVAARETFELMAPLANRLGVWQLKWELEDLAFRCEEPATYQRVAAELDEKRSDRESFITEVTETLRGELARAGVHAEVTGRPKHIYSIWKKMQRKDLGFKDLFDVRAVRVLVNDVKECYTVLGIVHHLWTPIPREFDDYIAKPKPNNYRSLHTAVIGPESKVLEVQIRTREMHQTNELGIAAHWRYKEGGKRDARLEEQIAWLRQVLDWRDDVAHAGEWAASFRTELFVDTVYVLTPQGRVVALPRGSTPIDLAYHVHSELGHHCRGAKVNGAIVPLTYALESGQRVEIVAAREGGPSRDWLNPELGYIRSHRARAKVRQWFNSQQHDESIHAGRAIVEREAHRAGVPMPPLEEFAHRLGYTKADDLFLAASRGDITTRQYQIAFKAKPDQPPAAVVPEARTVAESKSRTAGGVLIVGVDKLLTQLARCCKPAPPDAIVGFVTRGKGVSVHRANCQNVARLDPSRKIAASWGQQDHNARFAADVYVDGAADSDLMQRAFETLAKEKIPIRAARVVDRKMTSRLLLTVEVSGLQGLQRALELLGAMAGVHECGRRT